MKLQITYFIEDFKRMLGKQNYRVLYIWLSRVFWGIFSYRLDRGLFLLIGKPYKYCRILLLPIFNIWQAYSNLDISYKADIAGGLLILHPSIGIVVSKHSIIGKRLTLVGGNIIGAKPACQPGGIVIGDGCTIGANATIIGPIKLGNFITIGSLTCVVKDCEIDHSVLVGVPAKILVKN